MEGYKGGWILDNKDTYVNYAVFLAVNHTDGQVTITRGASRVRYCDYLATSNLELLFPYAKARGAENDANIFLRSSSPMGLWQKKGACYWMVSSESPPHQLARL